MTWRTELVCILARMGLNTQVSGWRTLRVVRVLLCMRVVMCMKASFWRTFATVLANGHTRRRGTLAFMKVRSRMMTCMAVVP